MIGSGFGGLAAAVRLAARVTRVTVCERLGGGGATTTGRTASSSAGPTIVTAPYLFDELWEVAGRKLQDDVDLRPIDPFYEIRFDDGEVIACRPTNRMRAEVTDPEDLDGFDKFMAVGAEIYKSAFLDLADVPFHGVNAIKSAPDLVRHAVTAPSTAR